METNRIYLSPPHMGESELEFVKDAFASNWISPAGPHLALFESELADFVGVSNCVALSSGTAAIHLALKILGVSQGDEVICQSFTFSGSCNPILYQNAQPVFVDSEHETWNMDPEYLRAAINERIEISDKKPKAIIVVHLYGMPAKMDEIMAIAREFQIPVIEDAAEALGSVYKGRKCGSIGDFGILSFNGNKIITTSGGGALLSNRKDWIDKARFLSTQAREPVPHYEHKEVGYNYRLSNVCAAIGLGQMKVLQDRVNRRRSIFRYYQGKLATQASFQFLSEANGFISNRWLSTILLRNGAETRVGNERIRRELEKSNIESRPLWKPMHLQPIFLNYPFHGSGVSAELFDNGLCLPSGSQMRNEDLDQVVKILIDAVT